jgi:hypothetical protein
MMKKMPWVLGATGGLALWSAALLAAYGPASSFAQERGEQERGGTQEKSAPAQRGGGEQHAKNGVGNGHIPAHGPTPTHGAQPNRGEEKPPTTQAQNHEGNTPQNDMRRSYRDQPGHPAAPHVHANNDQWVGNRAGDAHYHLAHPWEHGHFPGTIGAHQVWRLHGGGPNRFAIGGYFFEVAPYDVPDCADWNWNDDDIILYDDSDDPGWYLAYDVRLGTYCHVMYLGQ